MSDIVSYSYIELPAGDVPKLSRNPPGKSWVFVEHTLHGQRCWLVAKVLDPNEDSNVRLRMARIGGAVECRERHLLFTHARCLEGQATAELLPASAATSNDLRVIRRGYLCCPATLVVDDGQLSYALFEVERRCLKHLPKSLASAIPLNLGAIEVGPRRTVVKILSMTADGGEIHGNLFGKIAANPFNNVRYTATFYQDLGSSTRGTWVLDKETGHLFGHVIDYNPATKVTLIVPSQVVFRRALIMLDPQFSQLPQQRPQCLRGEYKGDISTDELFTQLMAASMKKDALELTGHASGGGTAIRRRVGNSLVNHLPAWLGIASVCFYILARCLFFVNEDAGFLIGLRYFFFLASLVCSNAASLSLEWWRPQPRVG